MNNSIIVTFDADWAPRFILEDIVSLLEEKEVKGTIFATDIFDISSPYVEIGMHPNFMSDSTQGETPEDIVKNLLPRCSFKGIRTHRFFWYSNLLDLFSKYEIKIDSSIYLPLQKGLVLNVYRGITRCPVWWSDNLHLELKLDCSNTECIPNINADGLKVLDFHPVNIYYNISSTQMRHKMLNDIRVKQFYHNQNHYNKHGEPGVRDIFIAFLEYIKNTQNESYFLSQVRH